MRHGAIAVKTLPGPSAGCTESVAVAAGESSAIGVDTIPVASTYAPAAAAVTLTKYVHVAPAGTTAFATTSDALPALTFAMHPAPPTLAFGTAAVTSPAG